MAKMRTASRSLLDEPEVGFLAFRPYFLSCAPQKLHPCAPQKLYPRLLRGGVRVIEAVFVMEPAENLLGDDCSLAR